MSLAADTREAVRAQPFLYEALRAGVLNYTATARYLDLGDEETVAAALRRYAVELPDRDPVAPEPRVEMDSGIGPVDDDPLLAVGGTVLGAGGGDGTAVLAHGDDVDPTSLERVLARLRVTDVTVDAAGGTAGSLVVVVPRRAGARALRVVEETLS